MAMVTQLLVWHSGTFTGGWAKGISEHVPLEAARDLSLLVQPPRLTDGETEALGEAGICFGEATPL